MLFRSDAVELAIDAIKAGAANADALADDAIDAYTDLGTVQQAQVYNIDELSALLMGDKSPLTDGVAAIGTMGYDTLEEAIVAVQDGETITLLADITLSGALDINQNISFTLDLNGKEIDCDGYDLFAFEDTLSGATVTLLGGTVINAINLAESIPEQSTLNIHSGTFNIDNYIVNDLYGSLNIKNGYFTIGNSYTGTLHASGTVVVDDGTLDATGGNYGFDYMSGSVTINGGTLIADDDMFYFTSSDEGSGNVVINNGTFITYGDLIDMDSDEFAQLTINDGTFTAAVDGDGNILYIGSGATANVYGGTFTTSNGVTRNLIRVEDGSILSIFDGSFSVADAESPELKIGRAHV